LIARESIGDKVVTPINTSQVVEHIGKNVIRTKVGSPFVVEGMKNSGLHSALKETAAEFFLKCIPGTAGE